MTEALPEKEVRPKADECAFIYLNTDSIRELRLMLWADFKLKFGLYLTLALPNGEVFILCMRSLFKGKGEPVSFQKFAEATDRTHYLHRMPDQLVKLLDGT